MKILFRNDTDMFKMKVLSSVFVLDPWMGLERGEGEKEIANHGRSRVKSFSQETRDKAQQRPRNGAHGQVKSQVQDARRFSDSTPLFSFSRIIQNG
jgi:hypothetical protein